MKNLLKGYLLGIITTIIVIGSVAFASNGQMAEIFLNQINVNVNGTLSQGTNILYKDRVYVQLRDIGDLLGCSIGWDSENKEASIYNMFQVLDYKANIDGIDTDYKTIFAAVPIGGAFGLKKCGQYIDMLAFSKTASSAEFDTESKTWFFKSNANSNLQTQTNSKKTDVENDNILKRDEALKLLQELISNPKPYDPDSDIDLQNAINYSIRTTDEEMNARGITIGSDTKERLKQMSDDLIPQYKAIYEKKQQQKIDNLNQYINTLNQLINKG